jgi:hypothetical protein
MSRARVRDPLGLSPNWHIDCRLEAELPEDNLVGTRFLINVVFGGVALGAFLFAGWLGYLSLSLRHQIHDWEQRIKDNRAEVNDIRRMQRDYATEAAKIDQAFQLVRPDFFASGLILDIGRTRPDAVVIETIEWNDGGIVIRGSLRETPERASRLIGSYVESLRGDQKIGPRFTVLLTDLDRGATGEAMKFEISFRSKTKKS